MRWGTGTQLVASAGGSAKQVTWSRTGKAFGVAPSTMSLGTRKTLCVEPLTCRAFLGCNPKQILIFRFVRRLGVQLCLGIPCLGA